MDPVPLLTLTTALVLVGLGAVLAVTVAGRRRVQGELEASRAELAELRERLDRLAGSIEPPGPDAGPTGQQYLITSLSTQPDPALGDAGPAGEPVATPPLSGREFASVALAESAVRIASLAHGVRRALSAENRNRIGFEMGREVKRSRRQRRRDLKEARRHLRTEHSAEPGQPTGLAEDAA